MFTLIIKIQIIFAQQLVLVSVFLSGYKNMVLNQSAWVFALGYFQNFDWDWLRLIGIDNNAKSLQFLIVIIG